MSDHPELGWPPAGIAELPDLNGREALNLVAVLHGLIAQVWRVYGGDMAAAIAMEGGGLDLLSPEASDEDDDDLPF